MKGKINNIKKALRLFALLLACVLAAACFAGCAQTGGNEAEIQKTAEEKTFEEKTGGWIEGVCHPNENYEQIAEANIGWMRFDCTSLPYDPDDETKTLTQSYLNFKARAKGYADNGFKVMAITPYPEEYIDAGLDPRDEANEAKIKEIARFYATDLQGIVAAFQITNEMGIETFTLPLTLSEACKFIGIQLEAMYPVRGDIIIGYNNGGLALATINEIMQPWLKYCDYVGVDIYLGCFEDIMTEINWYTSILGTVYSLVDKPILLNEFGYMGAGQPKSEAEKLALLKLYGAQGDSLSEAETYAKANYQAFVDDSDFPSGFRAFLNDIQFEGDFTYADMAEKLFGDYLNHLYKELPGGYQLNEYEHTQAGQAAFFTDTIALLKSLDYVYGCFVYCYCDSDACYICGQSDCPVETGWGLVDCDGVPKPAYYAVREAFAD